MSYRYTNYFILGLSGCCCPRHRAVCVVLIMPLLKVPLFIHSILYLQPSLFSLLLIHTDLPDTISNACNGSLSNSIYALCKTPADIFSSFVGLWISTPSVLLPSCSLVNKHVERWQWTQWLLISVASMESKSNNRLKFQLNAPHIYSRFPLHYSGDETAQEGGNRGGRIVMSENFEAPLLEWIVVVFAYLP